MKIYVAPNLLQEKHFSSSVFEFVNQPPTRRGGIFVNGDENYYYYCVYSDIDNIYHCLIYFPSPYQPIPRIVSALNYSKHPFVSVSIKWSFKYHHSFLLLNKVTLLPLLPSSPLDTKKKKKHVKAQLLPI